jgi:hypothetical protein
LPLLQKSKEAYLLWFSYYQVLPKISRHSLGRRIDDLFVEIMEAVAFASFLTKDEKLPWVRIAVRKMDTLKIWLLILWETKTLDNKKYGALSVKLEEAGRMLGGWYGQVKKHEKERLNSKN